MGLKSLLRGARSYPVPVGDRYTPPGVRAAEAPPAEYGEYLATSNEVYSAVSLRARLVSSVDLRFYNGTGPDRTEVTDSPAVRLLRTVNPHWTWERLARMDELCMGLWGETFWAIEKDRAGRPTEIWWMKPTQVTPIASNGDYLKGYAYQPADGGKPIAFAPGEVCWFRYPNPNAEFTAMSPLSAARLAADTSSAMMKANRQLFKRGMRIAGVVVPDTNRVSFTKEQADDLQVQLEERFTGAENAHRWAVLRYEAQFRPMQVSAKDAEFVEGLNLTLRQVANAYGIPVPLLNDLANATLANAREYERILWAHTLVPDTKFKAAEIREQFLPLFTKDAEFVEHDYTQVPALQEAASEVWSREYQAMQEGALTINEWRKRHGLPSVPWGDVPWMPVNKLPVVGDLASHGQSDPVDPPVPADMPRTVAEFLSRAGLNGRAH